MEQEPDKPVSTDQAPRLWKVYAGAFIYAFLFGLPGLQMLTVKYSAMSFHFGMDQYAWYLILCAICAVPLAGMFYPLWRPLTRLEPLQRIPASVLLTLPIPIFLVLAAYKLGWFNAVAGLESRYALLVWLVLMAPVSVSTKVFHGARKTAVVLAKVLSPLPLVMAVSLFSMPRVPSVQQSPPTALETTREGAPVYMIVFDALDRNRVFKSGNEERFPTLFQLKQNGVWFSESRTHGHGTENVVPCLLFQRNAVVTRNDDGEYLLDDVPSGELDSVLTTLGGPDSLRVVGGFHLNYSKLLENETDWICEYSLYSRRDGLTGPLKTSMQLFTGHMFMPRNPPLTALQSLSGAHTFADDTIDHSLQQLEEQLMECAASPNHDLVAFFHMTVPHMPFIYDRNGRRLETADPEEDPELAYLLNVEYVDAMLARFIEALKESGQWDDATIVVTGDHGVQYEDRPPLVVKLPGQHAGRVVEKEFVSTNLVRWLDEQR